MKLIIENESDELELTETEFENEARISINCIGMWITKSDAQRIINHLKLQFGI